MPPIDPDTGIRTPGPEHGDQPPSTAAAQPSGAAHVEKAFDAAIDAIGAALHGLKGIVSQHVEQAAPAPDTIAAAAPPEVPSPALSPIEKLEIGLEEFATNQPVKIVEDTGPTPITFTARNELGTTYNFTGSVKVDLKGAPA